VGKKTSKAFFISLVSIFFLLSEIVSGQDGIKIQGKVTDNNGNPLIGANIIILNTSYGASTERNGFYFIDFPASENEKEITLEARYVGYISKSVSIILTNKTTLQNFTLEEDVLSLKTVVVTAQRREENLQIVPISITAIESDEIINKGAKHVKDLRYSVPNLSFGMEASYTYGMITTIRGIAGTSNNTGAEPRTGYYIDDIYCGRRLAFNQDLLEIERVTVLRGPQGTLFGKNVISGLINLSTRKPHGRLEGNLRLEGGNYNSFGASFMLNLPVIENRFFAKIAGKISRRDGYVTNIYNNKDTNGEETIGGRLQFRYLPSDELEFLLNFDAFESSMVRRAETILNDGRYESPRELSHDEDGFDNLNLYSTALTVNYRLQNGHNFKSISSFRWNNNWNGSDWDFSSDPYLTAEWTDSTTQFTQEFRLTSPLYEIFDYVAGLYYLYQNIDKNASLFAGPDFPVPDAEVFCKGIVIRNSIAGYVNTNLHLIDNLTLNAGLRYTYEKSTAEFNSKNYPEPIFYIDVENYTDTYSEGVLSPKLGLNYSLSPNVFIYGFVAQGFTSGGWNLYFSSTLERIKYLPEYATNFEIGFKTNWWNNRVIANLSTFLTKFKDFQVGQYFVTEEGIWESTRTNAGKVTTRGFELEVSILLLKELKFNGGWGYVDARFDEYKNAGGEGIDYDGNRLPWSPKNDYNISIEYQQAIGKLGSILLFGEFVHQGNYFCMASNDIPLSFVDSHELLNARVGFNFADNLLGISIWGRNLLDKLYLLDNSPASGIPSVWYGPPRMYGIDVYYNFLR
jgi:iron complex outermembrane receptor protein